MRRIAVTGAGGSAAANFVNALRLAEDTFYFVGLDSSKFHLELADVDARYVIPDVADTSYLDVLNSILAAEKVEFVHPQPDVEVAFLSKKRDDLVARTYLPADHTVELCQNKALFFEGLADAGLPTAAFSWAESEATLREAADRIVSEYGEAWIRAVKGAGAKASLPVSTAEQAVNWAKYWVEAKGLSFSDFMVMQVLPGKEYAFQSIWKDGNIVTSQARERLEHIFANRAASGRTSSPSVARTVHRDDVNEIASAAIRAIDPKATGVFCADLREDARGRPFLTEVNAGRFFTTSNFFAEAGSNMPYWYIKLGYGELLPTLPPFNAVPDDLYWIRMVDMGFKLVREGEWTSVLTDH